MKNKTKWISFIILTIWVIGGSTFLIAWSMNEKGAIFFALWYIPSSLYALTYSLFLRLKNEDIDDLDTMGEGIFYVAAYFMGPFIVFLMLPKVLIKGLKPS